MAGETLQWYEAEIDGKSLFQGDIFNDIPVVFLPHDAPWIFLRPPTPLTLPQALAGRTPKAFLPRSERDISDAWEYDKMEFVLAKATKKPIMLLNQTCDLNNRNWFQVAPVVSAKELDAKTVENLKNFKIFYRFFLPAHPPHSSEDRYVDLSLVTSVHKSYFQRALPSERLTEGTTSKLRAHLAKFLGRPFGFDKSDIVDQPGEYLCVPCFYNRKQITAQQFGAGVRFPDCPKGCTLPQWVRGPRTT